MSRGTWQDTNPSVVDARRIVITSNRLGAAQGWLLELDGTGAPRAVTPSGAVGSSASPDGALVAYATRSGLGIRELASGTTRVLTNDPSDAAPVFTRLARWPKAMPQYPAGHLERLQAIDAGLQDLPGLTVAGAGFCGIGIPDCVRQGTEAAHRLITYVSSA